jgi:hypothetical protein
MEKGFQYIRWEGVKWINVAHDRRVADFPEQKAVQLADFRSWLAHRSVAKPATAHQWHHLLARHTPNSDTTCPHATLSTHSGHVRCSQHCNLITDWPESTDNQSNSTHEHGTNYHHFRTVSVTITLLVQLQTHTLLILGVGKLLVVLFLSNVAKSLSVPT